MPVTATRGAPWLDVGVAVRALPGQRASGDREVVRVLDTGALIAAVDGLGHGAEAAEAARRGCQTLERFAGEPPTVLIRRCHAELVGTRGAAMSLAWIDGTRRLLSWLSVGNVEGVLWQRDGEQMRRAGLITRGGVVGSQLPPLREDQLPVRSGDVIILATDGIRPEFSETPPRESRPQALANYLLSTYARDTDDALVLVARVTTAP